MKRLLALLVLGLAAGFAAWPGSALGHAALSSANPPENAFLQRPPAAIELAFTEPLDTRLSSIKLLDAAGSPLKGAAPLEFSKSGMKLPLNQLPPGIYNVLWANVSSVDGHQLSGSYPFTVLEPDGSLPQQVNTVGASGGETDPAPEGDGVAVRALALLGLLIVTAGPLLLLLGGERFAPLRRPAGTATLLGAAVLVVATVLNFAVIRDVYSGLPLRELIMETRAGNYWLARMGAAILIAVLSTFVVDAPRRAAGAILAAALAYLWAFTATSHAAAGAGSTWAMLLDILHGVAAVAWIGGVIGVALAARLRGRDAAAYRLLMPRFGLFASIAVFILLATGTLGAFIEIGTPGKLFDTRYGVTLLVKLGLMGALLTVAFYNARWGRRKLEVAESAAPRRFLVFATGEIVLGLLVFAVAAALTQSTASKLVPEDRETRAFDQSSTFSGLNVRLQVDPNRTGLNSYAVTVTDVAGAPVAAQRVRLTFRYLEDQTVGPSALVLAASPGSSVYRGQGPYLTLEGQWRIEAEIRQANADDVTAFFNVRPAGAPLGSLSRGGAFANPAPRLSWNEFGGLIALITGLGLALFKRHLDPFGRRVIWGANGSTAALFGVGALLLFGVHTHEIGSQKLATNPIFPDQNSISMGRTLFQANCAACHGQNGVPPSGLNLNPYPLDLTVHAPQHPDGALYLFIHDGIPGSAMRAWGSGPGKLSDEEIWHVVNYLRTLGATDR